MAILKALLIGDIKEYGYLNATETLKNRWKTAMFKVAQSGEVEANELGFIGDSVADTKHHGGREKAIFANSFENYDAWEKFLGLRNLPFGAMGENLTIGGLDENVVCIGDIHEIGSLTLQVSQPRKPCFKLSKRWMNKDMASEIFSSGRTGWYYRVLKSGSCKVGDEVKIIKKDSVRMSVMEINRLFYEPKKYPNLMSKFLNLTNLTSGWQEDMRRRIEGVYSTEYMRNL